jgi:hypothetical protein
MHAHIKRHGLMLGDYYVKHFQRRNKLTGDLLPFKNVEDYFERDFSQPGQIFEWCEKQSDKDAKAYLIEILKKRIAKKNLDHGPTYLDLASAGVPSIDYYKKYFGSYTEACSECKVRPLLGGHMPKEFWRDYSNFYILVDTREKQPLKFKKCGPMKLDVGDYGVTGPLYNYTFVDRKNFTDFCTTVTVHYNRFSKELDRCRQLGCYMFVVIDEKFEHMEAINKTNYKKFHLDYVYHNMRSLQAEYSDCCQFVFSGSRERSVEIIPKLLVLGRQLWKTDVQYFWSKYLNHELASR